MKQVQEVTRVEACALEETWLAGLGVWEGQPTPSRMVSAAAVAAMAVAATAAACIVM